MNKAKSLRFHPPSDFNHFSCANPLKEFLEQLEILFWRAFIRFASTLPRASQEPHAQNWAGVGTQNQTRWRGYLLFSTGSLLGGVLLGFLYGHLF